LREWTDHSRCWVHRAKQAVARRKISFLLQLLRALPELAVLRLEVVASARDDGW
jgi:hypothetical protein